MDRKFQKYVLFTGFRSNQTICPQKYFSKLDRLLAFGLSFVCNTINFCYLLFFFLKCFQKLESKQTGFTLTKITKPLIFRIFSTPHHVFQREFVWIAKRTGNSSVLKKDFKNTIKFRGTPKKSSRERLPVSPWNPLFFNYFVIYHRFVKLNPHAVYQLFSIAFSFCFRTWKNSWMIKLWLFFNY